MENTSNDSAIFDIVDSLRATTDEVVDLPKDIGSNIKDVIHNDMGEVFGSQIGKLTSIIDFSSIKDVGSNIKSTIKSDISSVLDPGLLKLIGVFSPLTNVFKNIRENWSARREERQSNRESFDSDLMDDTNKQMSDFANAGLEAGSIYTHDITSEMLLKGVTDSINGSNQHLQSMDDILSTTQKMEVDTQTILKRALDELYNRGGDVEEEDVSLSLEEMVGKILNTLKTQASDIKRMRLASTEEMGIVQKMMLPITSNFKQWILESNTDIQKVESRLVEIKKLLADAHGLDVSTYSSSDKNWKMFGKIFVLAPLKIGKSILSLGDRVAKGLDENKNSQMDIFKGIKDDFLKKDDTDGIELPENMFTLDEARNKLLQGIFDALTYANADFMEDNEKQVKLLSSITEHYKDEKKLADRTPDKKNTGIWKYIEIGVLLLGGYLYSLGLNIKLFIDGIKKFGSLLNISKWPIIKDIPKYFSLISNFFISIKNGTSGIIKSGGFIGRTFSYIGKFIDGIRKFGKIAFSVGSKIIGIIKSFGPIANIIAKVGPGIPIIGQIFFIISTVIDFIKGFIFSTGTIIDRIQSGLESVVKGFLEFPIKILGWIVDWLLGIFKIKIDGGSGEAMMKGIMFAVHHALEVVLAPFKMIWNGIWMLIDGMTSIVSVFTGEGTILEKIIGAGKEAIGIILIPYRLIYNSIKNIIDYFGGEGTTDNLAVKAIDMVKQIGLAIWNVISFPFKMVFDAINEIIQIFIAPDMSLFDKMANVGSKVFGIIFFPFRLIYNGIKNIIDYFAGEGTTDNILDKLLGFLQNIGSMVLNFILDTVPGAKWVYDGVTSILDKLGVIEKKTSFLDKIVSFFSNIGTAVSDWMLTNIPGAKWISEGVGNFVSNIGVVTSNFLDSTISFFSGIGTAVSDWMLTNIPGAKWISEGIGSFIAGIGVVTSDFLDSTISFFSGIGTAVSDWMLTNIPGAKWISEGIGSFIAGIGVVTSDFLDSTISFFSGIGTAVSDWMLTNIPGAKWISEGIGSFITTLGTLGEGDSFIDRIVNFVKDIPSAIWDSISSLIPSVDDIKNKLSDVFSGVGSKIKSFFSWGDDKKDKALEMGSKVVDKAKEIGSSVVDKTKEMAPKVVDKAKEIGSSVVDKTKEMAPKVKTVIKEVITYDYSPAISNIGNSIKSFVSGLTEKIKGYDYGGLLMDINSSVHSFFSGITSKLSEYDYGGLLMDINSSVHSFFLGITSKLSEYDYEGLIGNITDSTTLFFNKIFDTLNNIDIGKVYGDVKNKAISGVETIADKTKKTIDPEGYKAQKNKERQELIDKFKYENSILNDKLRTKYQTEKRQQEILNTSPEDVSQEIDMYEKDKLKNMKEASEAKTQATQKANNELKREIKGAITIQKEKEKQYIMSPNGVVQPVNNINNSNINNQPSISNTNNSQSSNNSNAMQQNNSQQTNNSSQKPKDIPEETDNYLLSLVAAGIMG